MPPVAVPDLASGAIWPVADDRIVTTIRGALGPQSPISLSVGNLAIVSCGMSVAIEPTHFCKDSQRNNRIESSLSVRVM